jgi:hypothetical protein
LLGGTVGGNCSPAAIGAGTYYYSEGNVNGKIIAMILANKNG